MNHTLISLNEIINEIGEGSTQIILKKFSCQKDKDVENFLRNKAILFNKMDIAKTYLYFNNNDLENNEIVIMGYFSISGSKTLGLGNLSNNLRKKIVKNVTTDFIPCYLIGQIGRDDNYSTKNLNLEEIFNDIYIHLSKVIEAIGGRIILLECKRELVNIYQKYGYVEIQERTSDDSKIFVQMIKLTKNLNIVRNNIKINKSPNKLRKTKGKNCSKPNN